MLTSTFLWQEKSRKSQFGVSSPYLNKDMLGKSNIASRLEKFLIDKRNSDVTKALKRGKNELTIKVINTWVNRLIGDQQTNASKVAFTDVTPYSAGSPLMPSGLIGPVQVLRGSTK